MYVQVLIERERRLHHKEGYVKLFSVASAIVSKCRLMNKNLKRVLIAAGLSLGIAGSLSMRSHYSRRVRRLEMETQSLAKQMSEATIARASSEEAAQALARRLEGQTTELVKLRRQVDESKELQSRVIRLEA